ncbi:MAG: SGNH/GDSL hydrolase family protein [Victivallales bacterium]|nr:SGNH/GDSL hydrolase family protein [Victivallales bacterium]
MTTERNYEAENTVPAARQMVDDQHVFFLSDKASSGRRVLFIGNSITLHGYRPSIGWFHSDCGMAASGPEHDYVHLVLKGLSASRPAIGCIAQIGDWELNFWDDGILHDVYQGAADWKPELVIARLGENVRPEKMAQYPLLPHFVRMVRFFAGTDARVVVTDTFWPNAEKERILAEAAQELGAPLVHLADLGTQDSMKAVGLFEHSGVAGHPGDAGMAAIAERILAKIS